jgi:hypothetical protein
MVDVVTTQQFAVVRRSIDLDLVARGVVEMKRLMFFSVLVFPFFVTSSSNFFSTRSLNDLIFIRSDALKKPIDLLPELDQTTDKHHFLCSNSVVLWDQLAASIRVPTKLMCVCI